MKKGIFVFLLTLAAVLFFYKTPAYAYFPVEEDEIIMESVDNREYADLVIAQVSSWVNVRDYPDENKGKVLGKLYNNSVGHFIEETDGWYKIQSGTVTGYVKGEYCVRGVEAIKLARDVEVTYATINVSTLRVREKPTTESSILGTFSKGDDLVVLSTEDGFAKVTYNNKSGFISMDYVDIHTEFVEAESKEEEEARLAAEKKAREEAQRKAQAALAAEQAKQAQAAQAAQSTSSPAVEVSGSSSELGQQVIDYAVQFVGNPYVYGGTSLTNGCDCSGFVMSIYAHFGVKLPRTGQRNSGYAISSLAEAQPGDILCYSGHVALYMGNNQIVHAATPSQGIVIGDASYTTIIAIRRIF
ncbi:MAG: C40 family peptidase [Lachnospiraceae bacterium]|nr:C40 family peptidase [Lachnospiraceae bacterium]